MALGAIARLALGPRRFFSAALSLWLSAAGEAVLEEGSADVWDLGVPSVEIVRGSSSSSSPSPNAKESFPLATLFRFFFFGSSLGVKTLCFDHQCPPTLPALSAVFSNLPITRAPRGRSTSIRSCGSESTKLFLLERLGASFAEIG